MKTGVFATQDEMETIVDLASGATMSEMLAARFGPLRGAAAWRKAQKVTHAFALDHGLPEIPGYYGLSSAGEFVTA